MKLSKINPDKIEELRYKPFPPEITELENRIESEIKEAEALFERVGGQIGNAQVAEKIKEIVEMKRTLDGLFTCWMLREGAIEEEKEDSESI